MHIRQVSVTLLASGMLVLGSASAASAVCDAYSGTCTPAPSVRPSEPIEVLPTTIDREAPVETGSGETGPVEIDRVDPGPVDAADDTTTGDTATNASTLPFTGGELVLMTALGAGALAGGTALVMAGRRRNPDTTA